MKKQPGSILFGPDVIRYLLPHRRPFLMVDVVTSYERSPHPTLCASRHISANESIFEGHFPGLHLWPGVYTIEGLGQATNILHVLWSIENACEERGIDPGTVLAALSNLHRGYELKPGYRKEVSAPLIEGLMGDSQGGSNMTSKIGMAAAVDIKFVQPVFAGQRLDYRVTQTHVLEGLLRFDVQAHVDGQLVARGTMTGTRGIPPIPPAPP